jgi:NADH-quinone oxidoreductase subunit L
MSRLMFLTFFGAERIPPAARHHLHESPAAMTLPLAILGVLSLIGGFVGLPAWLGTNRFEEFLAPSLELAHRAEHGELPHTLEMTFAAISVLTAVVGILVAYRIYLGRPETADRMAQRFRAAHDLLFRKYYVDEIYDAAIINPTVNGSTNVLWKGMDTTIIDGAVNGVGRTLQSWAGYLKNIQNGLIRSYATWILFGAAAVLLFIAWRG